MTNAVRREESSLVKLHATSGVTERPRRGTLFRAALIAAAFAVSLGAFAAENNYWQPVNGSLDGSWGDAEHWSLGRIPAGSGEIAVIDPLRVSGGSASFTITVDEDYAADTLIIGDPDNTTRNQGVTFVGAGSLTFAGEAANQSIFRACSGGVTLDGPSISLSNRSGLLNYSVITVKNGSSLWTKASYTSWKIYDNLRVEDGGSVSFGSVQYGNSAHDHSITVSTGGVFVCRGSFQDGANPANDYRFGLIVNGGSATVDTLKLTREAAFVRMTSGSLLLNKVPQGVDLSRQLDISGGRISYGFDVLQDASDPWYALATNGPTLGGCQKLKLTNGVTCKVSGDLRISQLLNADPDHFQALDCDRLIFYGNNWPFQWTGKGSRVTHLYGPMEIRVDGTDLGGFNNHYLHCHGKFVVDTRDWSDPTIKRTVAIRGFSASDGSLELVARGGGTFKFGQAYAYNTGSSFTVEEGTALVLGDRDANFGKSSEWGPLVFNALTLGKDVTVTLTAGLQHVCASRWSIDPSVRFTVTIPASAKSGAYPILLDLDSKDLPAAYLDQIALAGNAEGWQLKNEHGQISAYKHDTTQTGMFGEYEWIGGRGDNWGTAENWNGGSLGQFYAHQFGASVNNYVWFNNVGGSGGTTIGKITFQTNAVSSFFIDGGQITFNDNPSVVSYSWVPQVLTVGLRVTGSTKSISAYYPGPIVYAAKQKSGEDPKFWEVKGGCTATFAFHGDVRCGCGSRNVTKIVPQGNVPAFPGYRTTLSVISGGNLTLVKQDAEFDNGNTAFRVSKGGTLEFAASDGAFYCWSKAPANIVVDGTMKIGVPYRGGCNQTYDGSGRLDITAGTQSYRASSVTSFGETLQVYPATWSTVTAGNEDKALAMGANGGTPVIHVADGWTYGPATGVTPTCAAAARAFRLANQAVATIDPAGGVAVFADPVSGDGTLAVANGTLRVTCPCDDDEAILAACKGATLSIDAAQRLGGLDLADGSNAVLADNVTLARDLSAAGATLAVADGAAITVAGDANLSGTAFALGAGIITKWRTLCVVGGRVIGTPQFDSFIKARLVKTDAGTALQCKSVIGTILLLK